MRRPDHRGVIHRGLAVTAVAIWAVVLAADASGALVAWGWPQGARVAIKDLALGAAIIVSVLAVAWPRMRAADKSFWLGYLAGYQDGAGGGSPPARALQLVSRSGGKERVPVP